MVFFMNSEKKRRHRFANESIENAEVALKNPFVQEAMGHYASQSLSVLDQLYVPNHINGVFEKPKKLDDTKIPIIPLMHFNALIRPDLMALHPTQRLNLDKHIYHDFGKPMPDGGIEILSNDISESMKNRTKNLVKIDFGNDTALAAVHSWGTYADVSSRQHSRTYNVRMRPMLLQRMHESAKADIVMIHEIIHILQLLDQVVIPDTESEVTQVFENELQAYRLNILAGIALYGESWMYENYSNHMELENLRMITNGPNLPYFVNEVLYDYMIETGIASA